MPLWVAAAVLAAARAAGEPPPRHGVPEGCVEAVTLFCADPSWPVVTPEPGRPVRRPRPLEVPPPPRDPDAGEP